MTQIDASTLGRSNQLVNLPTLDRVIDRSPLTVTPDTPVVDAIALMSQARGSNCALSNSDSSPNLSLLSQTWSSCVLVVEGARLLGIFTERDVLKITANRIDLSSVKIAEVMTRQVITLTQSNSQNIFTALSLLRQHRIRHLPILDSQDQLVGIITTDSIRQVLQPANLLKLRRVAEVMATEVLHAPPTASVLNLARLMADHNVSCVVIFEEGVGEWGSGGVGEVSEQLLCPPLSLSPPLPLYPVGIITERDIVQFRALDLNLAETEARTVMSAPLFCLSPGDSLWVAHQEMQARHVRRLVVAGKQGELLGILTQTSLLQVLDPLEMASVISALQQQVEEQTAEIRQVNQQLQQEVVERQQAEAALRESEERFRRMANSAPVLLWTSGTDGLCNFFNQGWLDFTGRTLEQEQGLSWAEGVHPNDVQRYLDNYLAAFNRREPFEMEYRLRRADGEYRWLWDRGVPRFMPNGEFAGYIGSGIDITDRKEAEETLRQAHDELERRVEERTAELSQANALLQQEIRDRKRAQEQLQMAEERLRHLLTSSPAVIYSCQPFGNHTATFVSDNITAMLGYESREFLENPRFWLDRIYPEDAPRILAGVPKLFEQGYDSIEYRFQHKDGSYRWVQDEVRLVRDVTGVPLEVVGYWVDVTEKKQLEAQFYRAQRLESLGTLASGIAHDLNNILTPILAIAQLLPLKFTHLDEPNQQMLKMLETNAKRGADLVKQILSFARGSEGKHTILQVRHLLLDIEQIIKGTFPKSIEIKRDISQDLWTVSADATQLHQVLMNLVVNARDAMPNGGTLTISAANLFIDENYTRMNIEAKVGSYVVITVADTGVGIPPEIIDRIFDPFLTTKEVGKGTGLGLSTVLGIIKNHGGFVEVSSEVGKGSQFKVYLPSREESQNQLAAEEELLTGQGELILLVDDEPVICEITKTALETHNYRVLTAKDGIEAIALYAQHQDEISVVLMDMMMPSMDGATAIRTLQKMKPEVQIIAMSGLTSTEAIAQAAETGVKGFLSKPFTTKELLNMLQG